MSLEILLPCLVKHRWLYWFWVDLFRCHVAFDFWFWLCFWWRLRSIRCGFTLVGIFLFLCSSDWTFFYVTFIFKGGARYKCGLSTPMGIESPFSPTYSISQAWHQTPLSIESLHRPFLHLLFLFFSLFQIRWLIFIYFYLLFLSSSTYSLFSSSVKLLFMLL